MASFLQLASMKHRKGWVGDPFVQEWEVEQKSASDPDPFIGESGQKGCLMEVVFGGIYSNQWRTKKVTFAPDSSNGSRG